MWEGIVDKEKLRAYHSTLKEHYKKAPEDALKALALAIHLLEDPHTRGVSFDLPGFGRVTPNTLLVAAYAHAFGVDPADVTVQSLRAVYTHLREKHDLPPARRVILRTAKCPRRKMDKEKARYIVKEVCRRLERI